MTAPAEFNELIGAITKAIDDFHATHPDLLFSTILNALEEVRHNVSVAAVRARSHDR